MKSVKKRTTVLNNQRPKKVSSIMNRILVFCLVIGLACSCIPNEKIVYLQNKENQAELENDTLIELKRTDYRLQPNDILLINFYATELEAVEQYYPIWQRRGYAVNNSSSNNSNGVNGNNGGLGDPYITGYNLDKDGIIVINSLGRIRASGLTTSELEKKIEEEIRVPGGVKDIEVRVKLQGINYTIYGEVTNGGSHIERTYELPLIQVLANHDLTLNANREKVILLRDYPEACSLVLEAGTMGEGGEIFVFDMGKSIKIVDLAKRMIRLSGLEEDKDIKIVFTGLRPGEKLYEELLDLNENHLATHHPKIMIAKTRHIKFDKVRQSVELNQQILSSDDIVKEEEIVKQLKGIMKEYKSNASRFEELDK